MTQIQTDQPTNRIPQIQPTPAPNLRLIGENGAGAFSDLFAEKTAPPIDRPADTTQDDTASPTDQSKPSPTSDDDSPGNADGSDDQDGKADAAVTGTNTQAKGSGEGDSAKTDQPADAGGPESTGQEVTNPSQESPSASEQGVAVDNAATGPTAQGESRASQPSAADRAVPITGQQQVRQELKHAARVDLASLARQELLGTATPSPNAVAEAAAQTKASREPARPTAPTPRAETVGVQSPAAPPAPHDAAKPPPGFVPPAFKPDSAATHTASNQTPGKSPSNSDHPISAAGQQRTGNGTAGSGDATARADAAASKAVFLERLANAGGARRGAVSAAERTVGIDRAMNATESKPATPRPVSFKPIDPPPPARDAFLSPVQKGLGKMLAEGGGRLTVMLRPQELGDVRIAMETKQGAVRVKMEASSEAARRVLESGLDSLRATLESRGVRVESMDITSTDRPGAADPDARGGSDRDGRREEPQQHASPERGEPRHQDEMPAGLTDAQTQQLWTELGIDAVA